MYVTVYLLLVAPALLAAAGPRMARRLAPAAADRAATLAAADPVPRTFGALAAVTALAPANADAAAALGRLLEVLHP
ncbi:hypothetical protein SNA_22435 [Streptomyces natalensis ATCC 27448]|uniref:M56 family peptidase n=1 Tax=Streptomyces natalensis ATCC 27448 TaxID=1240678 RepID=A0A0D7CIW4_9ACTN|nr:hypothetical protein SNA_22435 [Streptomyces natalensis ATCC 27448]